MSLRWADSNEQVQGIPEHRQAFFDDIKKRIETEDPAALGEMLEEICGEFQRLMTGEIDYTSVPRFAPGTWEDSARQVIYDVTEDVDQSRWWLGLLVIDIAVKYPYDLIALSSGGEQALRYMPDVRQLLHPAGAFGRVGGAA